MYALFDSGLGLNGDTKQLHAIAEFFGGAQILRRNGRDAFDIHGALIDLGAECEACQNGELLCSVVAIDVERWVGFRITQTLRVLEALGEGETFLLHPRQDVIASAVENTINAIDRGAGQTFA